MKKAYITLLVLTISLTANAQWWGNSEKIKGNGKVTTEVRKVGGFDKVTVGGSFDVILIAGKEGKVTLEGEENVLEYIITEVNNGKLEIKFKNNTNVRTTKKLTATVPFEAIEAVSLGGSGNVFVKKTIKSNRVSVAIGGSGNIVAEVEAENISASIGGSGDIKLSGKATTLKCSIAGSGSIKAYELETEDLKASIAGSGSVKTHVNNKIKASVVGSGSVYYKGNPSKINTSSIGSGDVIDRN